MSKPVNEEQLLWALSWCAGKTVWVGWESAWLCQHKTNVCNKLQLRLVWLSVMVQNECDFYSTGSSGEQTNQGSEGWSLKCLIGFAGLFDICVNPLTSIESPKATEGGRRKQFCALKMGKWKLLGEKEWNRWIQEKSNSLSFLEELKKALVSGVSAFYTTRLPGVD